MHRISYSLIKVGAVHADMSTGVMALSSENDPENRNQHQGANFSHPICLQLRGRTRREIRRGGRGIAPRNESCRNISKDGCKTGVKRRTEKHSSLPVTVSLFSSLSLSKKNYSSQFLALFIRAPTPPSPPSKPSLSITYSILSVIFALAIFRWVSRAFFIRG